MSVAQELEPGIVKELRKLVPVLGVDIQGFVGQVLANGRSIVCRLSEDVVEVLVNVSIVHRDISGFCFSKNEEVARYLCKIRGGIDSTIFASMGSRGTYSIHRAKVVQFLPLPINRINDVEDW